MWYIKTEFLMSQLNNISSIIVIVSDANHTDIYCLFLSSRSALSTEYFYNITIHTSVI